MNIILAIVFFVLLTINVKSNEIEFYDNNGNYAGKKGGYGHFYNKSNQYIGRLKKTMIINKQGNFKGNYRNGKFYDERGFYKGKLGKYGHIYDKKGNYVGKYKHR